MASVVVTIQCPAVDTNTITAASNKRVSLNNLKNIISGINSGSIIGGASVAYSAADPVAAVGTATITYATIVANDTIKIGQTTFTCVASGANGTTQFNKVTDATATASSLVTAINANTTVSKYILASSALGVVTLTAREKGVIGNAIVLQTPIGTGIALVQPADGAGGVTGAMTAY